MSGSILGPICCQTTPVRVDRLRAGRHPVTRWTTSRTGSTPLRRTARRVHPGRDALVKELRAAGDRGAADRVAALRRPTKLAAELNWLAREEPDALAAAIAAEEALAEAQRAMLDGRSAPTSCGPRPRRRLRRSPPSLGRRRRPRRRPRGARRDDGARTAPRPAARATPSPTSGRPPRRRRPPPAPARPGGPPEEGCRRAARRGRARRPPRTAGEPGARRGPRARRRGGGERGARGTGWTRRRAREAAERAGRGGVPRSPACAPSSRTPSRRGAPPAATRSAGRPTRGGPRDGGGRGGVPSRREAERVVAKLRAARLRRRVAHPREHVPAPAARARRLTRTTDPMVRPGRAGGNAGQRDRIGARAGTGRRAMTTDIRQRLPPGQPARG